LNIDLIGLFQSISFFRFKKILLNLKKYISLYTIDNSNSLANMSYVPILDFMLDNNCKL